MKAIYFTNYNLTDKSSGVSKKIAMQISAFKECGVDILAADVHANTWFDKLWQKLPGISSVYDYHVHRYIKKMSDVDFAYFRHDVFTRRLIKNLNLIKKRKIRVIYEIPTYPYDLNENKIRNFFVRKKDRKWRNRIGNSIDYIVDYSGYPAIYGVNTINIFNGINPEMIRARTAIVNHNTLNLIGVALLAPVHGFDRIILAIKKYYDGSPKRRICFHVVGDGDAKKSLVKMANELGVERYIYFHGFKGGEELDAIYDIASIGVGALGIHRRIKGQHASGLKTKEYCAKGIPFITSETDEAFPPDKFKYQYIVGQNEEDIDLSDVINWYERLVAETGTEEMMASKIRMYASENLRWSIQLQKVIDAVAI